MMGPCIPITWPGAFVLNTLALTYFTPLLFGLLLLLPFRFKTKTIIRLTSIGLSAPLVISLLMAYLNSPQELRLFSFSIPHFHFDFILWTDSYGLAYLFLTHFLGLVVLRFSHTYLQGEKGFQRFFATILIFIFGMYLLCLAGTMDLFFAGWEIVGISSFFLIAFYRSHNRSISNAWRIYNIYRICDVGLLLSAVIGHLLWHEASSFSQLTRLTASEIASIPFKYHFILGLFIIFASLGKSAQFPFHNWPSRAMEGPTPSSAIFYGALSIHAGVFLLIRTEALWSSLPIARGLLALIGLTTFVLSFFQKRVQANIKGQIAYASTMQIGIMFILLAMKLYPLVMLHLILHALWRCFQMLTSPSVVLQSLTHPQREKRLTKTIDRFGKRLESTLYSLSINDFMMDVSARGFHFIQWYRLKALFFFCLRKPWIGTIGLVFFQVAAHSWLHSWHGYQHLLTDILSSLSLLYSAQALFVHRSAFKALGALGISLLCDMASIYTVIPSASFGISLYMIPILPALIIALITVYPFRELQLQYFHSQGQAHPIRANIYLMCFMIISGMPLSSAFFGEDIILAKLIETSYPLAIFTSLSLMMNGLICVRIYVRLFMGRRVAI
jgi:NADH-quinone oxidoreductase subunit L